MQPAKPIYVLEDLGQQLLCRIDLANLIMQDFCARHVDLLLNQKPNRYLVNCHEIDNLMSAQLGRLIWVNKMVKVVGGQLELFRVNEDLMQLLMTTGLQRQLLIHLEGDDDDSTGLNGSPVPTGPRNGPRYLSEKRRLFSKVDDE